MVLILSPLSDSVHGRRGVHIFKHRLYITALEQARVLKLGKYILLGVTNTIKHNINIDTLE